MSASPVLSPIAPRRDKLLYQQVRERIMAGIESGVFRPGDKLPPLKHLAQAFELNHITIRKGLDLLKAEGILAIQPGVGIFVCGPDEASQSMATSSSPASAGTPLSRTRQLTIGLVCVDAYRLQFDPQGVQMHPLILQMLKGIRDNHAADRISTQVLPNEVLLPPDSRQSNPLSDALASRQLDGLLVGKYLSADQHAALQAWNIPSVLMFYDYPDHDYASSVLVDLDHGLGAMVRHLQSLGHRRITVLSYHGSEEFHRHTRNRVMRVMASQGQADFTPEDYVTVRNYPGLLERRACQEGARLALDRQGTAIIAYDELLANHVHWAASQAGRVIPRDLSLASLVDMLPESHALPLTTLNTCDAQQEASRLAMDLLTRQIDGQDTRHHEIRLMPSLIQGQTTGPASPCDA